MTKTYEEIGRNSDSKFIVDQNNVLKSYIEDINDALFIVDKNYNYFSVNKKARELAELKNNPYCNLKLVELINKIKLYDIDDNLIEQNISVIDNIFEGKILKEMYMPLIKKDDIFYYSVNGSPVYNNKNEIEKILFSLRDITEQVKKDKLINMQKNELQIILENIFDILIVVDIKGNYIYHNQIAEENVLFKNNIIRNVEDEYKYAEHYDLDRRPILIENSPQKKVICGEKFSNYKIIMKNDKGIRYYEVSGTPLFDGFGNFIKGILLYHDISDKVRNEENLYIKKQNELISNIIDNVELQYLRFSYPDFKIIDMNKKAYKGIKQTYSEIKSLSSLIGEDIFNYTDDITKEDIENIVNTNTFLDITRHVELETEMYLKIIYHPVYGLSGKASEIVCIAVDITDDIKEKEHMEKMLKFHDDLIINISHELKTPLNIIYSAVQLMEIYIENYSIEDSKEHLIRNMNSIEQNYYRLTKLINNILDLSKLESGHFEINLSNENIVEVIENIVDSVSEYVKEKQLNITFDTNTEEKIIACDSDIIERIMLNLISNAIKFSNSGGNIYINVYDKHDVVEISVIDSGTGMDSYDIDNIFDRFSQTDKSLSRNAEGSGIGLKLVKSLVNLHGGDITVKSKPNIGSAFIIELPAKVLKGKKQITKLKYQDKIDMMNIEFSDIYDKN